MDVREKLVGLPIEDAILVLREEHRQRTDGYTTYLEHGGKCDPAEEVGLGALAMAISALEKTKWISVTERLPDWRDGKVLVFTKYGFSICERTVNNRWRGQHANWITQWAYLPKPPKGE